MELSFVFLLNSALLGVGLAMDAFSVSVVRLLLGAIFAGNGSAFLFSLLGGLVSLSVMALLSRTKVSVYGISLAGAAAHQCGQIGAAMLLLKSLLPIGYLPALLLVSLLVLRFLLLVQKRSYDLVILPEPKLVPFLQINIHYHSYQYIE